MQGLSKEAIAFLSENFGDANDLLKGSKKSILFALYDLIDEKGFAPPDYLEYNDFGRKAQKIYDDIYLTD